MTEGAEIKIRGELMPDPDVCTFHVPDPLLEEGWTVVFQREGPMHDSPLAEFLFGLEEVVLVRVADSRVTVVKQSDVPWTELAGQVVPVIREALLDDRPALSESAIAAVRDAPAEDIGPTIEKLFDVHINPALASHGGYARLVRIEERDVYLEMGGGCQGCAASQATLRHGIEAAIRQVVPQGRDVIDVPEHASGENPYYD